MSESDAKMNAERRRLLKITALGLASMPFASSILAGTARAADLPLIDEKDATAQALKYTCDGSKNAARKDANAVCETCMFYTANADKKSGACVLFPGKSVCAKGWCTSYQKKA
ncbi:High-potential iron-sulfur protein [Burkholderiales bacterium]|jgi:hypothetical protein|nr:High-potential iron-sulfur protein [Burkholderiales bacterium]